MIAEQTPEEVIERQKAAVYRLAYSRLQNREDAEDVLQEGLSQIHKKRAGI